MNKQNKNKVKMLLCTKCNFFIAKSANKSAKD